MRKNSNVKAHDLTLTKTTKAGAPVNPIDDWKHSGRVKHWYSPDAKTR